MSKKYTNKSKLLGKIGTENYRVSNCPVHLPKENIKFFMAMQDAGNKDPFSSDTWNNQITPDWKKPFHESIVSAISKGIKNALNESNGLVSDEECLRANLVCLYDHCEQDNFFIIKNPSVEDIEKIGTFHDRYYWHKKDTDDKKDHLVANMIQWGFYNIKLDGLTSIEYDDENINLCSFDLKNDEELYKFVYKIYLDKDQWADSSKLLDRLKYVLNMIDQIILNKRDHYGFGLGTRLSFIEYFFKDYKENLEKYNKGNRDYLKRIKEKEQILSSFESFKSYMKDQVKKSVCAGDSSRAILLLNLKTEQIFDKAPKTKIHFIKTFQEYKDEMYKLLSKDRVNESFDFLNESKHQKEIDNDSKEYDEKWIEINQNNKLYKLVDQTTENNNSRIAVHYIAKIKKASNYIICLYGGLNGSGHWINYLKDLINVISKLLAFCKYAVIAKIDTDVLDDVWRAWITIEPKNVNESFDFNSVLNEGSWGYDPNDGDGPLDMRFEINLSTFEQIYDLCKKTLDDAKKQHESSWAWDVVGQIEYFFDRATSLDNLADEPDKKFEKYDFWWKLQDRKKKDILELYKEALDICEKDKHWINSWREPKRMITSLKRRHRFLDKMLKIKEQKDNYEKKLEEKQVKNNKKQEEVPDIVAEGFMFEGECCGECGGVGGSYNTPMNTVGVGNVVPAQGASMTGAQQASDMFNGSGDITILKSQEKSKKKKTKNLGVTYFPLATKKGV